jgi:hypothetical protein
MHSGPVTGMPDVIPGRIASGIAVSMRGGFARRSNDL